MVGYSPWAGWSQKSLSSSHGLSWRGGSQADRKVSRTPRDRSTSLLFQENQGGLAGWSYSPGGQESQGERKDMKRGKEVCCHLKSGRARKTGQGGEAVEVVDLVSYFVLVVEGGEGHEAQTAKEPGADNPSLGDWCIVWVALQPASMGQSSVQAVPDCGRMALSGRVPAQ